MVIHFRSLADIDTDGNLSPDEFCVAMYLIDIAKSGQSVPPVLPPDLIPPAYRRMRRPSETVSLPVAPSSLVMNVPNSHGGAAGDIIFYVVSLRSFIYSGYFYRASSSPLLIRGAPGYSIDTVLGLTCRSATGNYE